MELFTNEYLIIMFTPIFVLGLFQLSSWLGMTQLSTGMALMEIEDFSELTNIPQEKIVMIPMKNEQVKFKVIGSTPKEYVSDITIDLNSYKILEKNNIEIDMKKFFELKRIKFAHVVKADKNHITISEDGNVFTQTDENNNVIASVSFSPDNEVLSVEGRFKKFF